MRSLLALLAAAACSPATSAPAPLLEVPHPEDDVAPAVRAVEPETVPPPRITTSDLVERGRHWRIVTPKRGPIHVWIPNGYARRRAETVIYVHGLYTTVDGAWKDHFLPTQFAASGINAVFIACEAPSASGQPVVWTDLAELLDTVEKGIAEKLPRRRIVGMGHSGAYRTLARWLPEPLLDTIVLIDAAYGELESFREWTLLPHHRLIDVGDGTKRATDKLHETLPGTVTLDGFPAVEDEIPREAARAKILYIRSSLGHFPLVTGGEALPMLLRTLRAKKLLDVPLADLLSPEGAAPPPEPPPDRRRPARRRKGAP
jgi:hypothetical protein